MKAFEDELRLAIVNTCMFHYFSGEAGRRNEELGGKQIELEETILSLIEARLPRENKDHLWADDLQNDDARNYEGGWNDCLKDIRNNLGLEGE